MGAVASTMLWWMKAGVAMGGPDRVGTMAPRVVRTAHPTRIGLRVPAVTSIVALSVLRMQTARRYPGPITRTAGVGGVSLS